MANSAANGGRRPIPWRMIGWGSAALLLLLPLAANAPWTLSDFVFMGVLFGGVGLGLELAFRKTGSAAYRTAAGVALAAAFLLVWINGAVGIIGSEQEDANLLFGGVLAVGLLGAIGALFSAAGMARAMAAAALAQLSVPIVAWALWPGSAAMIWSREVVALTGIFAGMWILSAVLFRKAAREQAG